MAEKGEKENLKWEKNNLYKSYLSSRISILIIILLITSLLFGYYTICWHILVSINTTYWYILVLMVYIYALINIIYRMFDVIYNTVIYVGISNKQLIFKIRKKLKSYLWKEIKKICKNNGTWIILLKNGKKDYKLNEISIPIRDRVIKKYKDILNNSK